jgi:hypothetical protein
MRRIPWFSAAAAPLAIVACSFACHTPDTPVTGIVVGVTSDLHLGTDFNAVQYELKVNGSIARSETIAVSSSTLPLELPLEDLAAGDAVEVNVHALLSGLSVVDRTQRTTAVEGRELLLRVPLDASCLSGVAPQCSSTETCAAGQCIDVFVDSRHLPSYTPDWGKKVSDDPCKLADQAAVVQVGSGQSDYLPVADDDVLQVEAGPQGGYHVWLALRMQGLHQSSSVTTVTGRFPDLGYDVAPYSVVFTFNPSEGGFCKIYGLRFRLDDDAHPIADLLGKALDVTIQVADTDGSVGTGQKHIVLSDTIL